MRIGIVSDIHGNARALERVLVAMAESALPIGASSASPAAWPHPSGPWSSAFDTGARQFEPLDLRPQNVNSVQ
jgi:hypothetical protein